MKATAKHWNRENIQAILAERDDAVTRGMTVIHRFQTADERVTQTATEHNKVGWSKFDARIMSSLVVFYERRGYLSRKQMNIARRKMSKYAGQLAKVANGDVQVPAA